MQKATANQFLKRTFVLLMNEAKPDPLLSINNLTGSGRMDILCRVVITTFFLGDDTRGFRSDTDLFVFFRKFGKKIHLDGSKLSGLNPDERSIGGFLKQIFSGVSLPGVEFKPGKLDEILDIGGNNDRLILDLSGPLFNPDRKTGYVFVLGDHAGISLEDRNLMELKAKRVSLGPRVYLTSQCVSILHFLLDRNFGS